jgi:dienelactone hydrolase
MRSALEFGQPVVVAGRDGDANAWWHPADSGAAVVALGGVGNDPTGPSRTYPELAWRLRAGGVGMLRLQYRHAGDLAACVADVEAAVAFVGGFDVRRVVLIGWSFGGAVAIAAGAGGPTVAGVATIAGQTFGADAVSRLAPRSLLVVHGTGDRILPAVLSERLYAAARDPRQLVLYDGDDHALGRHRDDLVNLLTEWTFDVVR